MEHPPFEQQDDLRSAESTWLAERVPGRLDAEQANRPLESAFMQSFKHALLCDVEAQETTEYLNDQNEDLIHVHDPTDTALSYPLMMFSRFPDIPPEEVLLPLVDIFLTHVLPKMTLFRCILVKTLLRAERPQYLTFAMACIGSVSTGGPHTVTEALWWAANILIAATLEVDNRAARKVDLLNAWVLLETYGTLSADKAVWYRTNMTHGYVETAARRLCLLSLDNKEGEKLAYRSVHGRRIQDSDSAGIPAFVLIDMLRSIHYGLPPTMTRSELLSRSAPLNNDYNAIYTNIVLKSLPPPKDMGLDGAFLALVAILGDIHALATVFHPLAIAEDYKSDNGNGNPTAGDVLFRNPYLPFSPENENRQVHQRLQQALNIWSQSYLLVAGKDIAALFYFCKMYLSIPSLSLLPIIVGYSSSWGHSSPVARESKLVDSGLYDDSEALKNAWRILENVGHSGELTPVWFPIVLFYASLVVWRMINSNTNSGPNGAHLSLRVLQLFKIELEQMEWPCCITMAETLGRLMAG